MKILKGILNVSKVIFYTILSLITYAALIGGIVLLFSALGENASYRFLRVVGGYFICGASSWLVVIVFKGSLQWVARLTGGVILAIISASLIILGIFGGIFSSDLSGLSVIVGFVVVALGVMLGQLAALRFSPKYADAIGKRDYNEMVRRHS